MSYQLWRLPAKQVGAATVLLSWVLAGTFLTGSLDLLTPQQASDIGAGTFPALVALVLVSAGGVIAWQTWRGQDAEPVAIERPLATLTALGLLVGVVALLDWAQSHAGLAYVVFAVFSVLLQAVYGERRLPWLLGGSAVVAVVIWLIFSHLLRLPL